MLRLGGKIVYGLLATNPTVFFVAPRLPVVVVVRSLLAVSLPNMHGGSAMTRLVSRRLLPVSLLALGLFAAGCATTRLDRADFEGRRLAAVAAFPPAPVVFNEYLAAVGVYPHAPAGRPASGPAATEEDQVRRLQGMLKAATQRIDLAEQVARAALVTGAERLGATIADDPQAADYVLDLRVYHYGLYMRSYRTEANFYLDAELLMRNRATDEVVWRRRLDRLGTYKTRLTGAQMAHLSEADLTRELEAFIAFAADRMAGALARTVKNG